MKSPEHKRGGNSLLFGCLLILNIAILILGIIVCSFGIYSCEENNNFSWNNGSFIFIGCLAIATSFLGHMVRYSPLYLTIYVVMLLILLVLQATFTSLVYNKPHVKIDNSDTNILDYVLIHQIINTFLCILCTGWYWITLRAANKHETVIDINSQPYSPFIKK